MCTSAPTLALERQAPAITLTLRYVRFAHISVLFVQICALSLTLGSVGLGSY